MARVRVCVSVLSKHDPRMNGKRKIVRNKLPIEKEGVGRYAVRINCLESAVECLLQIAGEPANSSHWSR